MTKKLKLNLGGFTVALLLDNIFEVKIKYKVKCWNKTPPYSGSYSGIFVDLSNQRALNYRGVGNS